MSTQIGIIGGETENLDATRRDTILAAARRIGECLGSAGAILITGGCSGVARAAVEGARKTGGITVGTPGPERCTGIAQVTVEICTPIGVGDFLFAGIPSCDSIVVLPGGFGTVAELAIACRRKIPLVFLRGLMENLLKELLSRCPNGYPLRMVDIPEEAARAAIELARGAQRP